MSAGVIAAHYVDSGYTHASLAYRWDASTATLAGLADGAPIHLWDDEIVAAQMSMANAPNRPTYKTGIRNGLAVARFDATDWMESNGVGAGAITIAIARKLNTTAGTTVQAYNGRANRGGGPIISGGNRGAYIRVVAIDLDAAATTNWERWILCMSNAGGSGSTRLYVDGVQVVSTTSAMVPIDTTSTTRLGASDGGTQLGTPAVLSGGMDLGEALFFTASLNVTEVGVLDAYLASKWG